MFKEVKWCLPQSVGPMLVVLGLAFILGCSSGGLTDATSAAGGGGVVPDDGGGTGGGTAAKAAALGIVASPVSIKSGNVESSTLTATVVDANNAAVKNLIVIFSANGGQLSESSAITNDKGEAKVTFSSGAIDPSNRTVNITATVSGVTPKSVPVTISGSNVAVTADKTNLTAAGTSTLTITAKDALGTAIYNAPVTVSASGAGVVTLSQTEGWTNELGQCSVTVTGAGVGTATVTASALGAATSQSYTVSAPASVFEINKPAQVPYAMYTTDTYTVTVQAQNYARVRFATTLGTFTEGTQVVDKVVAGGTASATVGSTKAGLATIQVWGYNGGVPTNDSVTDSLQCIVSAPAAAAAVLTLQPSASVVAPSIGGVQNKVKLTATVQTSEADGRQPVRDAAVAFSLAGFTTGGGEAVSPVVVYTDDKGQAVTYFQSGTLPSGGQGISVLAQVVGTAVQDAENIVIGGTPGSVAIGPGTEVETIDATAYRLPISVEVADSNGNPVPGQLVSLNLWPTQYSTGAWYDVDPDPKTYKFVPYISGTFVNEDSNEDMYRNVGEDTNLNGRLDPPNAAAGTIPQLVTTDANGLATFNLVYLKQYAVWTVARLRASVVVLGTETTSSISFRLPVSVEDTMKPGLPDSPFAMGLVTTPLAPVSYTLSAPFNASPAKYSTGPPSAGTSDADDINAATYGRYTFTPPVGAASGDFYTDTIYVDTWYYGTLPLPITIAIP